MQKSKIGIFLHTFFSKIGTGIASALAIGFSILCIATFAGVLVAIPGLVWKLLCFAYVG